MSDPTNQTIAQYLLGALPEVEAERLDELSVISEEFAESLSTTEKDLIDAYVQGELSSGALAQFESHYLASPLRRGRVEFAEAFQLFAAKQAASDVSSIRVQVGFDTKRKGGWFSKLNIFALGPAWQWGLAVAGVILLVVGGFLWSQNLRFRRQMSETEARRIELEQREQQLQKELENQKSASAQIEQELTAVRAQRKPSAQEEKHTGNAATIFSFVLTPQLRAAGQIKSVTVPAETQRISVQLQLEPNEYSMYRVALVDQLGRKVLWSSGQLRARGAENKVLSVSFSASLIRVQTYSVQVSGISQNGKSQLMGDYYFRVVK